MIAGTSSLSSGWALRSGTHPFHLNKTIVLYHYCNHLTSRFASTSCKLPSLNIRACNSSPLPITLSAPNLNQY